MENGITNSDEPLWTILLIALFVDANNLCGREGETMRIIFPSYERFIGFSFPCQAVVHFFPFSSQMKFKEFHWQFAS